MSKKINVGISKTDIGYFVDLHHTIIAGSYSPINTTLKDYNTDVERLNSALKPLNLEIVEKKIPMKPIKGKIIYNSFENIQTYHCECGRELHLNDNYCGKCGREIDWRDE